MTKPSKFFSWDELACRGAGYVRVPRDVQEADAFWSVLHVGDEIREDFGHPLVCRSGWRSTAHNLRIGGAWHSMHKVLALDLAPSYREFPTDEDYTQALADRGTVIEGYSANLGGIGKYSSFIHIDARQRMGRPKARWEDNATWRRYESTQRSVV